MKQTARNNELLAAVKRLMNAKIYQRAMHLMNAGTGLSGGEEQVIVYLQQFFNRPIDFAFFLKRS